MSTHENRKKNISLVVVTSEKIDTAVLWFEAQTFTPCRTLFIPPLHAWILYCRTFTLRQRQTRKRHGRSVKGGAAGKTSHLVKMDHFYTPFAELEIDDRSLCLIASLSNMYGRLLEHTTSLDHIIFGISSKSRFASSLYAY